MTATSAKRTRLRFTLGTLLVFLTFVCLALGWIVRARNQRAIVSQVEHMGGRAYYSYQVADQKGAFAAPGRDWLRDFYDHVVLVEFDHGYKVDLSTLAGLTRLDWLVLFGTRVNDWSPLADLRLKRVALSSTDVRDVSPLAASTDLEWLVISGTPVDDISSLANLRHLTRVDLSNTPIGDLSALAASSKLDWLNVSDSHVSDISAIANKRHLRHIDLRNTDVRDVSFLAASVDLHWLDMSGTLVSDVSALANLRNLTEVDLSNTAVGEVSALINRKTLTWLALDNTRVTDAGMPDLASAQELETLELRNTAITDVGLMQLEKLRLLKILDVVGTNVTAAGVERFKRAHPKCYVGVTNWLGELPTEELLFPAGHRPTADEINAKFARLGIDGRVASESSRPGSPIVRMSLRFSRLSDQVVLSLVEHMSDLKMLFVTEGLVGDDLVEGLGGKPIDRLSLRSTRVTDAGLLHLSRLPSLQYLELSETNVTDEGLEHLQSLDNLTSVDLVDTRVTRQGVMRLTKALPNCNVHWNWRRR